METIAFNTEGAKATITLKSPPLNIMTIGMMDEISAAIDETAKSPAKVLVIKGDGNCFSAGADVKEHMPGLVEQMMASLHNLFEKMITLEIPTMAVIHGNALGGGLELALCADMIYASESAKLGQPEILLGVFAPYASVCLPLLIGMNKSYELLLTGKPVSGNEAHRIGLVNGVFGDDDLVDKTNAIADHIASLSLPALKLCKKAVRRLYRDKLLQDIRDVESIYLNELMKTHDANEGLKAFTEKRKPVWKNA